MTANHSNLNLVLYNNMRFGEMIDAGWNFKGDHYWTSQMTNISKDALAFYEPIINNYLINYLYIYFPSMEELDIWSVLLNNAIATAVLDQAPVLNMLFYPSIQPDMKEGSNGVMNMQEDGTHGGRSVNFGTQFPQAMLDGNIGDYGTDGLAKSDKLVKYKASLDALKDYNDPNNPYIDAVHRIGKAVEASGVFSAFIY